MRRLSFWLWTMLGLLAAVASIAFANVIAARFAPRFDVTASGEHRLSPRAEVVLARLSAPARLIVAADFQRVSPEAFRDTNDVLDRFTRTGKLELALIDLGSPAGQKQYQDILAELIARDRSELQSQAAAVRSAATAASEVAAWTQTALSRTLDDLRSALPQGTSGPVQQARAALEQRAAGARIAGRDLAGALAKIEEPLNNRIGDLELPATDRASDALRRDIRTAADQVSQIVGEVRRLSRQSELGDPFTSRATIASDAIAKQRDRLSVIAESLARLPRPGVLRVASALRQSAAAIIVPPTGSRLTAIPLEELFPAREIVLSAGARADNRRRVEEFLTASLASTLLEKPPIAVFVHAEERPYVLDAPFLEHLRSGLLMKGIDIAEWSVLLEPEPSGLARLDPSRSRPAVYIVLPPDSTTAARPGEQRGGIERSQRLGGAVDKLAADHQNILLSLNPSIQRTYGDADPFLPVLQRFGLESAAGKPLFTERFDQGKREVETDRTVIAGSASGTGSTADRPEPGTNPVFGAIRGLPTYLPWPIGLKPAPNIASAATPLLQVPGDDSVWGESSWLLIWQTPRAQRAALAGSPKFDPGKDDRGPWWVAIASEIPASAAAPAQRMLAVGSSGWFFDSLTQPGVQVDGRVVSPFPGNQELFDSSVYWLAFADDLIAQSPQASSVPLIASIDPARLLWLRLIIIFGLPLCVLALGVVHRAVFG
ncbi:MAG: hypothetical protein JNK16_05955 [Phycisphaerales bacterium]|nr:hypothetical protein [Phycisphaerales bacterium]